MCCSLFWTVYFRHLAALVCKLMDVQSIWLFPPCCLSSANPPLTYIDPSLTRERSALKAGKKVPQAVTSDHAVTILKRGTQKCKQKVLVLSIFLQPAQETASSPLCTEKAKKLMTSEDKKWAAHPRFCLKVTLQFSVVQRCFYYCSFNFFSL